jgi:Enoyl-CoA hydratase/carnithine racemase
LSEYRTLRVERPRPGVVLATLDRPDRLNAISFEMFEEFPSLCAEVEADRQARVLIVTGAGRGFSAGLDLDEATTLGDMGTVEMLDGQERWVAGITAFRKLSKPVIAAVNGPAAGAGLALALVADLRIASTAARFGTAFVRIGLSGGDVGMSWMLPRIVGLTNAAEMLLTGDLVDAARAERIGLVSAVVEPAGAARGRLRAGRDDRRQQPLRRAPDQAGPLQERRRARARGGDRDREPQPGAGDPHR